MDNEYNDKLENILPTLESDSVQMIFADFPYLTTKSPWEQPVDLELFWREAKRILKPNGIVVATAQIPFSMVLGASNLKWLKHEWIWEKTQATGFQNAKKMPMKAHENCLIFYNKQPKYNPQKTEGHKPINSYTKYVSTQNNTELYGKMNKEISGGGETDRYPRSVLKFKSDKQTLKLHSTQKPEALLEYFIKTYSDEGDLILDPCRGSNTTGVCADRLNRKYIGIEMTWKFYAMGLLRREFSNLRTKELKQKFFETHNLEYDKI